MKLLKLILAALLLSVMLQAKEVSLENKIASLYVSFFNRAPDYAGLSYWNTAGTNVVKDGGTALSTLEELSAGFAKHPTFTSTYSAMNDEQFVNAIYNNALGKDGDVDGISYWVGRLASISRSDMVAEFMEISLTADLDNDPQYASLSAADKAAAQERQDLITNKVEAAVYFTKNLGIKTNLDPSTNAMDPSSLDNDPAYIASQRVIADVGLDRASVTAAESKIAQILSENNPIAMIVNSWENIVGGGNVGTGDDSSLNSNTSIFIFNNAAPSVRETQHQIGFGDTKMYESNTPLHCTDYGYSKLVLEDIDPNNGVHGLSYWSADMQHLCLEFDYANATANSGSTNVALYE